MSPCVYSIVMNTNWETNPEMEEQQRRTMREVAERLDSSVWNFIPYDEGGSATISAENKDGFVDWIGGFNHVTPGEEGYGMFNFANFSTDSFLEIPGDLSVDAYVEVFKTISERTN